MAPVIPGFGYQRVPVGDGVSLNVAVAGSGSPIVLLHGFPQTHLMWRHVAADLAAGHTVICPDLRGYGASDKPAESGPGTYSKRTMAADVIALARALGHERFALAGHDRGALVAFRAGLDHPEAITHLACLDVLPTVDMWEVLRGAGAAVGFHLYLMAQPPGLPEQMIAAAPDVFFGHFLDLWAGDRGRSPPTCARPTCRPAGRRSPRSWPTTAPRPGSTSSTTWPTARPAPGCGCRSPCCSRTGAPPSATTPPRCGAPGPRTCGT
ncbi:alpha/beta fold hydrolase [Thermocatellispora tengchongensis]|uniref:alpha/beta fold hydrolase n=1 Tax=Thermocatellispora tengchongensis TaxID=1073253 RepID=UPI003635EFDE